MRFYFETQDLFKSLSKSNLILHILRAEMIFVTTRY
jgi:hypothetical protein